MTPINIDSNVEFYLGIRNPDNKKYEGDRLFFDKSTTELAPCPPDTAHNTNQLWRFERATDYHKGVHAIVAVEAKARFTSEMRENEEDGEMQVAMDFTDIRD